MDFINELNKHQREAATTDLQHVRVIAGAGSGKTRVLTYRIAFLISEMKVPAWKILAITFTNKVAAEMQSRVAALFPEESKDLTIKTFHSFAAFFLRKEISILGYPSSFSIMDEEDQTKLVKDLAAPLGYKKNDPIIKKTLSYISSKKNLGILPEDIYIDHEKFEGEKDCLEIFTQYEEQKIKMNVLDFDDLLLKTNQILENYPMVREKWQRKIDFILVDEFQDTNNVEYKLLSLLLKPSSSLYVVGDPDQTIYTWRGANQDIILHLERDFPNIETIILDRNYRSTQTILDSANKLIAENKFRVEKDLYTENNKGEPIVAKRFSTSSSEAEYVIKEIKRLHDVKGRSYKDCVILYRSNYVSLDFETALGSFGIPYRLYGGLKFYQRREIKDVLAYFHLIVNKEDDIAFERVINVPKRNIGDVTISKIKKVANSKNLSLYNLLSTVDVEELDISLKVFMSIQSFIKTIDLARERIEKDEEVYSKILEDMLTNLHYFEYIREEDDGEDREKNIKALFQDLRKFMERNPNAKFEEYLQNVALISAQDELVEGDYVTLMTVHTAKGLEFPIVFVVRFNEEVFPNARAIAESSNKALEEERRLAYVAMTRAKELLYLTCTSDYSYVAGGTLIPSRFFKESGNVVKESFESAHSARGTFSKAPRQNKLNSFIYNNKQPTNFIKPTQTESNHISWAVGDTVIHKTLGRGKVIALEGDSIIKVNFDEHGIKSLLSSHPSVKKGN